MAQFELEKRVTVTVVITDGELLGLFIHSMKATAERELGEQLPYARHWVALSNLAGRGSTDFVMDTALLKANDADLPAVSPINRQQFEKWLPTILIQFFNQILEVK